MKANLAGAGSESGSPTNEITLVCLGVADISPQRVLMTVWVDGNQITVNFRHSGEEEEEALSKPRSLTVAITGDTPSNHQRCVQTH